ncbi:diacylglycerol kinase family protein [Siminovitchia sp. 179-K 8D1 HS]|uniref:diacylglycerol kinase family protein n=1 Tax=Siminovitchia sp. 179-K 8D1 HS TaxID=3142385 RepID=UPI0039A3D36A
MAWKDRNVFSWRRLAYSFKYAFQGIAHAYSNEKNFRFHIAAAILVTVCSFVFQLDKVEWLFILICIFGIFVLELINSALERIVDLISEEYSQLAKQAKDLAAGAVFMYTIMTVIIGLVIFLPKIFG